MLVTIGFNLKGSKQCFFGWSVRTIWNYWQGQIFFLGVRESLFRIKFLLSRNLIDSFLQFFDSSLLFLTLVSEFRELLWGSTTLKMRQFGDTRLIFSFWQCSFYHMFCPRGLHFVDPIISLYLIPYYSYTYIAIKCTLEWEPFPPSSLHSPDLTRHMHKPRWRLYGRTWPRNGFRHHDCLAKYQFCLCSYNQQNAWN